MHSNYQSAYLITTAGVRYWVTRGLGFGRAKPGRVYAKCLANGIEHGWAGHGTKLLDIAQPLLIFQSIIYVKQISAAFRNRGWVYAAWKAVSERSHRGYDNFLNCRYNCCVRHTVVNQNLVWPLAQLTSASFVTGIHKSAVSLRPRLLLKWKHLLRFTWGAQHRK